MYIHTELYEMRENMLAWELFWRGGKLGHGVSWIPGGIIIIRLDITIQCLVLGGGVETLFWLLSAHLLVFLYFSSGEAFLAWAFRRHGKCTNAMKQHDYL